MNARFVVDESGWWLHGLPGEEIEGALEALVDRVNVARSRSEPVVKSTELYSAATGPGEQLSAWLWPEPNHERLERDLQVRLMACLDRMPDWGNQEQVGAREVSIEADRVSAPSVAWACRQIRERRATACLPLRTSQRHGPLSVTIDEVDYTVHFVTSEEEHVGFFRDAIQLEDADESTYPTLARSAFPQLHWAEDVWRGLGHFSKPFRDLRDTVTGHLGVLNDHGSRVFREFSSTDPSQISRHLDAFGAEASDETGHTRSSKTCARDRTRRFENREVVFWWHTKLQKHEDRIHFAWEPSRDDDGRIIVGIFKEHCL